MFCYISRLSLQNRPHPLSSFDTHARWQPVTWPVTQSPRSRPSYGKIEDCEQSTIRCTSTINRTLHGHLEIRNVSSRVKKQTNNKTKFTNELLFILVEYFSTSPRNSARPCRNFHRRPGYQGVSSSVPAGSAFEKRSFKDCKVAVLSGIEMTALMVAAGIALHSLLNT